MIKNYFYPLTVFFLLQQPLQAETLNLESYLKQVQEQSPDIHIERSAQEIAKTKSLGPRIPDPMIGFMNMTESGSQQKGFEFNQELPFPSKITAEKKARENESLSQIQNSRLRQREILTAAKNTFVSYWLSFKKNELLREKKDWIKDHLKMAKAIAKADSTSQLHLLEIESEFDNIETEVLSTESDLNEKYLLLKIYTPNLKSNPFTPELPSITSKINLRNQDDSYTQAKAYELKSMESDYDYKKQTYFPDLVFRFRSYEASEMKAKNEEVMIGLTLPFVFFWQARNESQEAALKVQKAQMELQKVKNESQIRMDSLSQRLSSLQKQLHIFQDKLLPRAHKRMKLVENLSIRNMEGLNEHRNVMVNYIDLKMKELELRTDYENLLSELEKYTPSEGSL